MTETAVSMIVTGRVQGVGFRDFTEWEARKRGLTGRVRNRPDGSVEIEAEGSREALLDFIARVEVGPPSSRVKNVSMNWGRPTNRFSEFRTEP